MELDTAVMQLEALGHPVRLKLYRALVRAGDEGLAVGTLQQKLDIPASTLSHHIKRLDETDLITRERRATTLICRANYTAMNALLGFLVDECCTEGSLPRATATLPGCG